MVAVPQKDPRADLGHEAVRAVVERAELADTIHALIELTAPGHDPVTPRGDSSTGRAR
jgi:hypothetical protein